MADLNQEELGELLSAYLDGELDSTETRLVEEALGDDEAARRTLNELRRTKELVGALPRHAAPSSIATEVQFRLERAELLGPTDEPQVPFRGRRTSWTARLSMAAMVGLIGLVGWWYLTERGAHEPGMGTDVFVMADSADKEDLGLDEDAPRATRGDGGKGGRAEKKGTTSPKRRALGESRSPSASKAAARAVKPGPSADARLAEGTDVAALQTHAFASETIRLRLTVNSRAEGDALEARLVERLKDRRSVDLAKTPRRKTLNASSAGSFFHRGAAGVNFNDARTGQILVRASREQIDGLVEELAVARGTTEKVALTAGAAEFAGLRRARRALRLLTDADPHAPADNEFLRELLKGVGVDPALLESVATPGAPPQSSDTVESVRTAYADRESTDVEARTAVNEPVEIAEDSLASTASSERKPGRLVDRRGRKLEKKAKRSAGEGARPERRADGDAPSRGARAHAVKAGKPAPTEAAVRYVTFVIEVTVVEPAKKSAVPRPPASRSTNNPKPKKPVTAGPTERK